MTVRRLDAALVARSLARSRGQAHELITAGCVLVDGRPTTRAGTRVGDSTAIVLTHEPDRWVSRAALKLWHGLELWPISVRARRCLDVGASTGGFTQVLLERGAGHVTALDVGRGQLVAELADDPRVTNLPGTNIRSVDPARIAAPFDVVVCDVSFISLALVLPAIRNLVRDDGDVIVLVKPQFEVGRERLGRRGVVVSPLEHRRVLREVAHAAVGLGLYLHGAAPSPITGADGNREFVLWLAARAPDGTGAEPNRAVADDMLDRMHRQGRS